MSAILNPAIIAQLVPIFVVFQCLVLSAAFMVWMERKVCAYIQDRVGPNRVGPRGFPAAVCRRHQAALQGGAAAQGRRHVAVHPGADPLYRRGVAAFSVVPFGGETMFFGLLDQPIRLRGDGRQRRRAGHLRHHLDGRYGIALAGWTQQQISLLGGLRSAAQMIVTSCPTGSSLAAVIMLAGRCRCAKSS